ncbi:histidinol-phosphatase HisJ family protein [Amedibacillus sp. YH-ame6]
MLVDYHVHSEFSDDSIYPMEEVICDAINKGLDEICFTEHVDYGVKVDWDSGEEIVYRNNEPMANVDYPKYFEKIELLKKQYEESIVIKTGMEFGIQQHTINQYEKLFNKYQFDFIIFSVHQIQNLEFWTQEFQKNKTQEQYNLEYYEEIYNIIQKYKNYSVLGHMDLIVRYDKQGIYPFKNIKSLVEKILKQVIMDNKGIEFNTSYVRYGLKDTTPSIDILKLYKELGGKIITIGSDCHKQEHLGFHIEEAKKILKELGFKYYCTYDKMNPVFHEL